jgi:uncharacterized protein (TIGR02246 family)
MSAKSNAQQAADHFAESWNDGDAAGLANAYAADGVLLDPSGNLARGRAAIEANFSMLLKGPMKGTRTRIEVGDARQLAPDVIFADATQRVSGIQGLPGIPSELEFHVAAILKEEGGHWYFLDGRPYVFAPLPPA